MIVRNTLDRRIDEGHLDDYVGDSVFEQTEPLGFSHHSCPSPHIEETNHLSSSSDWESLDATPMIRIMTQKNEAQSSVNKTMDRTQWIVHNAPFFHDDERTGT